MQAATTLISVKTALSTVDCTVYKPTCKSHKGSTCMDILVGPQRGNRGEGLAAFVAGGLLPVVVVDSLLVL